MIDVRKREASLLEAEADGLHGKAGGIFNAIETLFFDGGNQLTVTNYRGGSVAVVSINSENVHGMKISLP
jgi:hypothetical protein